MKASEARNLVIAASRSNLDAIYADIRNIAENGINKMHYYSTLTDHEKFELAANGYILTQYNVYCEISWE